MSCKPQPDMNTQLLMDIQEQLKSLRLLFHELKTEVKSEIRGCQRSLQGCKIAFEECAKGYRDVAESYEDVNETIAMCGGGGAVLHV